MTTKSKNSVKNSNSSPAFRVSKKKPLVDPSLMREASNRTKVLKVIKHGAITTANLCKKTKLSKHEVAMAIEYLQRMRITERVNA